MWKETPCPECRKLSNGIRFHILVKGIAKILCSKCFGKFRKLKRKKKKTNV